MFQKPLRFIHTQFIVNGNLSRKILKEMSITNEIERLKQKSFIIVLTSQLTLTSNIFIRVIHQPFSIVYILLLLYSYA